MAHWARGSRPFSFSSTGTVWRALKEKISLRWQKL
jgi:hypothetical protein